MRKRIYATWCEQRVNLYDFLRSKFGNEEVAQFPTGINDVNVYRIISKDVSLVMFTEPLPIFPPVQTIGLWGNEEACGEVEKIILEEVTKHKSEPILTGK